MSSMIAGTEAPGTFSLKKPMEIAYSPDVLGGNCRGAPFTFSVQKDGSSYKFPQNAGYKIRCSASEFRC